MNDQAILGLLKQGHPDALAEIVKRYRDRLVAYSGRLLEDRNEAEDVAQETFMRVTRAPEIDHRGLAGWLYAVTYRLSIDRLRDRKRAEAVTSRLQLTIEAGAQSSDAHEGEEWERVQAALSALDEPYRSAVTLRYVESLGFPELARRMGTRERTARTWVGRGLTRLRRRLGVKNAM